MSQYHVDAAQVASASSLAMRSGESIRAEVAAMLAHLTALEGSWQGSAATAFSGLLAQWRAAQAQVEQALDGLGTALGRAAQSYQAAEDNASRMFVR